MHRRITVLITGAAEDIAMCWQCDAYKAIDANYKKPQEVAASELNALLSCADHLENEAAEYDRAADFLRAGSCMQRMGETELRLEAARHRKWAELIRQARYHCIKKRDARL